MLKRKQDDLLKRTEALNDKLQGLYTEIQRTQNEQEIVAKELLETYNFLKDINEKNERNLKGDTENGTNN